MNATYDDQFVNEAREPQKASASSLQYMRDLAKSRVWTGAVAELPAPWQTLFSDIIHEPAIGPFAQKDVSKFIDLLKTCPKAYSHGQPGPAGSPARQVQLEDGMYKTKEGTIYMVYHTVHGNNQQVAKRLMIDNMSYEYYDGAPSGKAKVHFKYVGKAPLAKLTPEDRLSLADAVEFGLLYGSCAICGRTLTNELSKAIGIGPVCGAREFGGEYQFLVDQAKVRNEEQEMVTELDGMSEEQLRARLAALQEELGE